MIAAVAGIVVLVGGVRLNRILVQEAAAHLWLVLPPAQPPPAFEFISTRERQSVSLSWVMLRRRNWISFERREVRLSRSRASLQIAPRSWRDCSTARYAGQ
jgi:hypothetical protein